MDLDSEERADTPDNEATQEPSPPSPPSLPHTHTLPDFMGALNMRPKESNEMETTTDHLQDSGSQGGAMLEGEAMDLSQVQTTLAERFQKDPSAVLELLQAALSMENLSALLKTEYHNDKEKLDNLQNQLEASYHTLKECGEQKQELTSKMEETNERIKNKRKHLESLREELKALGDEELQLKRKRDASYTKCSDLKQKLKSSQEALQQISTLSQKMAFSTTIPPNQDSNEQLA